MTTAAIPRNTLWKTIAGTLSAEIAAGQYCPGSRLPSEHDLAARFGVNRHTVRHALTDLAAQGLTRARRGVGVFVADRPTDYPLGRRVRFHQNLAAAGISAARRRLRLETRPAGAREAEALALAPGDLVHVFEGVTLADNAPLALFRSIFPADRLPGLLGRLARETSVTAALAAEGVADYIRSSTRLTAKLATPVQALHLHLTEGAPILRSVAINTDVEGRPIEYGTAWFAGDRVTLVVTSDPG